MAIIATDLRNTRPSAREVSYSPVAPLTARTVQNAIEQLQAEIVLSGVTPPTIAATTVTFAMSPYAVLATDYILEVNTSGGVVVINPPTVGTQLTPLEIKDASGTAETHNIQITGPIEGLNPYLIDSPYGSVTIRANKAGTAYEVVTW